LERFKVQAGAALCRNSQNPGAEGSRLVRHTRVDGFTFDDVSRSEAAAVLPSFPIASAYRFG
jgi:hypothetical protein